MHSIFFPSILVLSLLFRSSLTADTGTNGTGTNGTRTKGRQKPQVSVGYFEITVHDDWFNQSAIAANRSIVDHFSKLYLQELDYWYNEYNDSLQLQEDTAISNAREILDSSEFQWTEYLNKTALEWWQNKTCSFGFCPDDFDDPTEMDYTSYYLDVLANMTDLTYYYTLSAYSGVGWRTSCSHHVDEVLENMSEWNKAGSSAAITIMALLPTFLAFGNL